MDTTNIINELKQGTSKYNFFPRSDSYENKMLLLEVVEYIDLNQDVELLKKLVASNPHLSDDVVYLYSIKHTNFLKIAIECKIFDINAIDHDGASLLYRLCSFPEEVIPNVLIHAQLLIGAGAEVNTRYDVKYHAPERIDRGQTCLMKAMSCQNYEIARELLINGADESLVNEDGLNAKNLEEKFKNMEVTELISEYFSE